MKKLLTIAIVLFSLSATAQKSDTLTIPIGKVKFIKIGEKVYKVVTTLEEVKKDEGFIWKGSISPIYHGGIYTPFVIDSSSGYDKNVLNPVFDTTNNFHLSNQ
jgi:hypothetical protein